MSNEQTHPSLINAEFLACFEQFDHLFVGFSGGLDSTVLLHALSIYPQLHRKLTAVHINHGISPNASFWQQHCQQWCQQQEMRFISESVRFDHSANIEERARRARYAVFNSLMTKTSCLILGHHQDDQAETVLLQLFRGAGIDGLAAMAAWGDLGAGRLSRPLLSHSRTQLEAYARWHQLSWIEDESNHDTHYARNYLRQQIMPLLAAQWPGVVNTLARTALHCQQAKNNLDVLAHQDFAQQLNGNALSLESLVHLPGARLANVLRVWLRTNQVQLPTTATFNRIIAEVIFARTDAVPEVSWGDNLIRRYQQHLYLDKNASGVLPASLDWDEFPKPLRIEGSNLQLQVTVAEQGIAIPDGAKIEIRFRQGGELFHWHGQHKHLKKLFQEWALPPWLRERTPLLYVNGQLAAVVGYAISDLFFSATSAWQISFDKVEVPHSGDSSTSFGIS